MYSTYYDGTNSMKFIDDRILFFGLSEFRSITRRNEGSEWLICIGALYMWSFIASIVDIRIKKPRRLWISQFRNMCYRNRIETLIASEAKRSVASSQESLSWLMGASRIAVSRKRCILEIWCIEQKVIVLTQIGHIWSEPARPGPARPGPARPGPTVTLLRRLYLGNYWF